MKQIKAELNKISKLLESFDESDFINGNEVDRQLYKLHSKGIIKALAPYIEYGKRNHGYLPWEYKDMSSDDELSSGKISMWLDQIENDIDASKKAFSSVERVYKKILKDEKKIQDSLRRENNERNKS